MDRTKRKNTTTMVLISDVNTRLHACSIESFIGEIFFCGTYELNEETRDRQGEIVVFHNDKPIHTTTCESGVLDMKVAHGKVACVLSTGKMELYNIELSGLQETPAISLALLASTSDEAEGLFLSVDIANRLSSDCWNTHAPRLAVSTQQGSILIFEYTSSSDDGTGLLTEIFRVSSAHTMMHEDMPAWIVFFDPHSKNRIISGGDDLCLNVWTLPTGDSPDETETEIVKVASNRKTHTAGVTSGQWHPTFLNVFATGSYDEFVRVWDVRDISRPLLEIHTGGGLWRVKWVVPEDPNSDHFLVLAGMHGGCHVYRLNLAFVVPEGETNTSADSKIRIREIGAFHHTDERNEKHLAYGVDVLSFITKDASSAEFKIASCSFYDNLVQIWCGNV